MAASKPRPGVRLAWDWLVTSWRWPGASLMVAAFLLVLLPVFFAGFGLAATLVFAQLPAYLAHQWEEHADDRFRRYVNDRIGGGLELLTPTATFWINSLGVWGIDSASLYAAVYVTPSAGLSAAYLSVVNGLSHVGQALRLREYNPGLFTAVALLLPLGGWAVTEINETATALHHAVGVSVAIGVHVAIIAHFRQRAARLRRQEAPSED